MAYGIWPMAYGLWPMAYGLCLAIMAPNSFHQPLASQALVEVHVELIDQLFNSIDPSPFHTRDMDPADDAFIVSSAQALPRDAPLALAIHLDRPNCAR